MSYYDQATFHPITLWPGSRTRTPIRSAFSGSWGSTLDLLDRELHMLRARRLVIEVDLDESKIRKDGRPRADAQMRTSGVILSFESRHGPLRYSCDRFDRYRDNLRALALGLEALRRVERYGIASRGEQYQGWKALPSGMALPEHASMTPEQAAGVFFDLCTDAPGWSWDGETPGFVLDVAKSGDPMGALKAAYRAAAKAHHPDSVGGDRARFEALDAAWRVLRALSSTIQAR